jgi:hypothetical protein
MPDSALACRRFFFPALSIRESQRKAEQRENERGYREREELQPLSTAERQPVDENRPAASENAATIYPVRPDEPVVATDPHHDADGGYHG